MSTPSNQPFNLSASRQLFLIFLLISFAASAAVLSCALSWPLKVVLLLICCVVSTGIIRQHAWRVTRQAIISLQHIEERQWRLTTQQGEKLAAELSGQSIINPRSVLLIFEQNSPKQRYRVIIPSDSLLKSKLRQLKALLLATKLQ